MARKGHRKYKIMWKLREKYGTAHHWVENVPVNERIIEILQNFKHCAKCVDEKKV